MKTKAEMKIEISNDRDCILIEASKLSLKDDFMLYKPIWANEMLLKTALTEVIQSGIEDFYRPAMDPSFSNKGKTKIHYKAGEKPAVGKSYNWWKETVKDSEFCLGTKAQYVAFLGILIKMLVAKGWTVAEAWDAVCHKSQKLGHYADSDNAKPEFEKTGSREICGFFDLANTYKILAKDEETGGFCLASGSYDRVSFVNTLAEIKESDSFFEAFYAQHKVSVPWLVLKK